MKTKIFGLIIVLLVLAGCNALENESTSASMLQIVSLMGKDLENKDSTVVFSDVLTNGSIFNDNLVAELNALPLDPLALAIDLTPYMDVLVDQIDVSFKRSDGHNVEGVDVPLSFTQPVSILVPITESVKIGFIVIRHAAKLEPPLFELREWTSQEKVLTLVAVVTIHGKDQGGHRVAPVTGYITVQCANFADPTASKPAPTPAQSSGR